jgi:hypothetical protein
LAVFAVVIAGLRLVRKTAAC